MNLFYFCEYRLTTLFLLFFLFFFIVRKYSKAITLAALIGTFIVTGMADYVFFLNNDTKYILPITLFNVVVTITVSMIINKYKDFRGLFTALIALNVIYPGYLAYNIVYTYTGSILTASCVLAFVDVVVFIIAYEVVRESLMEDMAEIKNGWGALCVLPAFLFLSCFLLTTWPVNIVNNLNFLPGVIVLVITDLLVGIITIRSFSDRVRVRRLNSNLMFMAKYSDRLSKEVKKVEAGYTDREELNRDIYAKVGHLIDMLKQQDYSNMALALQELRKDVAPEEAKLFCDNLAVSAMLMECESYAKEKGVAFSCSLMLPENLGKNESSIITGIYALIRFAVKEAVSSGEKIVDVTIKINNQIKNVIISWVANRRYNDSAIKSISMSIREIPEVRRFRRVTKSNMTLIQDRRRMELKFVMTDMGDANE